MIKIVQHISMNIASKPWFPIIGFVVVWIVAIICTQPFSNIPFGDEFAYLKPVQRYLETGSMQYTDWSSMTLVLQVWIGALVSWVFGFSITTLRCISFVAAISGVIALYQSLRYIGANKIPAFLLSLLLLFNPLFFQIGSSFATDIPFLGLLLWSVYFLMRFLHTEQVKFYVIGLVFCIGAFFIRDVAIIVPPAFAITYVIKHRLSRRSLLLSVLFIGCIVCCYMGWRWWLVHVHGLPKSIDFSRNRMMEVLTSPVKILSALSRNTIYTLGYIGMYCIPLFPIALKIIVSTFNKWQKLVVLTLTAILLSIVIMIPKVFEVLVTHVWDGFTIFINFGNVYQQSNLSIPYITPWVVTFIVCMAIVSGVCICVVIIRQAYTLIKGIGNEVLLYRQLLILCCLSIYTSLMFTQWMIPRYYLVMLPFLILLFYSNAPILKLERKSVILYSSMMYSVMLLYVSFSFVHDTFSRQRAYMQAFDYLENTLTISYKDIDGGFDYNAWKNYHFDYKATKDKNWWWVENPKYVVTDGRIESMSLVLSVPYSRWFLPGYTGYVYVHKNNSLD